MDLLKARQTATKLISENGKSIQLKVEGASTFDPTTGAMVSTSIDETHVAVMFPYKNSEQLVTDSTQYKELQKIMFAGESDCKVGGNVNIGSTTYSVKYKNELKPDTETVVYTEMVIAR